jgi:hypothetical protein
LAQSGRANCTDECLLSLKYHPRRSMTSSVTGARPEKPNTLGTGAEYIDRDCPNSDIGCALRQWF